MFQFDCRSNTVQFFDIILEKRKFEYMDQDDDMFFVWVRSYLECRSEIKGENIFDVTDEAVKATLERIKIWGIVTM